MASGSSPGRSHRDHLSAVLFTAFVGLVLWLPGSSIDELPGRFDHLLPEHVDKWIHFALFFVESRLLFRSLAHGPFRGRPAGRRETLAWTFALVVALGALTEAVQAFVPGRGPDLWDLGADAAGFFAWWTITCLWNHPTVAARRKGPGDPTDGPRHARDRKRSPEAPHKTHENRTL